MERCGFLCEMSALIAAPSIAHPHSIDAMADYESLSGGRIGLYAKNLRTGRTLQWRANERFVMCSTFKASLVGLILAEFDVGRVRLEDTIA